MENISRRNFIIGSGASLLLLTLKPEEVLAGTVKHKNKLHFRLPPKPIQYFIKDGKKKGGKILIIGGIHGNEPGAYKAADILMDLDVKTGSIAVLPRINFVSVLANVRGYNGDMNRKFRKIRKRDPDFKYVMFIKDFIKEYNPDVVLSLHDGYGFHAKNKNHWGQCIVIDAVEYKGYPLYSIAKFVADQVNPKITKKYWKIPVHNTDTFNRNTKYKEQRRSLTYYVLSKCNIPAFCIEASKQLPSLELKTKMHFMMIKEFFKIYNVEVEPSFDYVISNINAYINRKKSHSVIVNINGRREYVSSSKTFKVPAGSRIRFESVYGNRGSFIIPEGVNLNYSGFYYSKNIRFFVKDDFKRIFTLKFIKT
ncbi:M99 family carboxypeptidase catalytic domain-containing protein [Persephonella sp.]